MPKPRTQSGEKNLISQRLIELRKTHNMSQRDLAYKLKFQLCARFADTSFERFGKLEIDWLCHSEIGA